MAISTQPLAALSAVGTRSENRLWARLFLPSFVDCFYIALVMWMFAGGATGWLGLLVDGDTGFHIRTGEYVLDHGAVPREDLFSFSKVGQPWFAWEWLADVVLALAYRAAALKGVVLLAGVIIPLASALLFYEMMRRGANLFVALVVALLGVGAACIHNLARPHIFTTLFLAVSIVLLSRDRRAPDRAIWLLVPLTVVWTNLHGGFVALLACLGLTAVGRMIEGWLETRDLQAAWARARRYVLLLAASLAVTVVNPYGIQLHLHIAQYLRADWIRNMVEEFMSPRFRNEAMLQYEVLLGLGVVAAAALIRRRQWSEALVILFWAHQSLGSARHIPLFILVSGPAVAEEVTRWWRAAIAGASKKSVTGILESLSTDLSGACLRVSVWPVVFLAALAAINEPVKWPRDFPDIKFPIAMIDRHAETLIRGRVFTSDEWGDYLIYRSWPRQRVFFDGRSDFYGQELAQQYLRLMEGREDWHKLLDRHAFDLVFIPPEWPLASLLKQNRNWSILGDDGKAILFRRRGAAPERSVVQGALPSPSVLKTLGPA